ncbi:hypothetical protein L1987_78795 [Smallanthus sonchifolius]|uniref:Uncharacterized protein n=1 Tax=Smallanthus sonchifolius TaxID=185202 RepID=A0ACB8ZEQ8_9ASTR|nr:hypothetical protein L1987_78795 [Smallanthus sonchifolius]
MLTCHNQLDNKLPTEFGNLVNLKSLDLSYNFIDGGIPNSFSNMSSLISLNLSHNNLSGHPYSHVSRLSGGEPPLPTPENEHKRHLDAGGVLIAVLVLVCCMLLWWLLKKEDIAKQMEIQVAEEGGDGGGKLVYFEGGVEFTVDDLLCANVEMMGKGSYGTVYKATLVGEDHLVVKRLRDGIIKNEDEFQNEVNSIGRIRHENLLAMRAYYLGPNGEKLLVFDYMPKGSLASFLHVREPDALVNWQTRMTIMKGITRGLLNLHPHHNIVHGKLTSNNILLDNDLNPKITYYGLSW